MDGTSLFYEALPLEVEDIKGIPISFEFVLVLPTNIAKSTLVKIYTFLAKIGDLEHIVRCQNVILPIKNLGLPLTLMLDQRPCGILCYVKWRENWLHGKETILSHYINQFSDGYPYQCSDLCLRLQC